MTEHQPNQAHDTIERNEPGSPGESVSVAPGYQFHLYPLLDFNHIDQKSMANLAVCEMLRRRRLETL